MPRIFPLRVPSNKTLRSKTAENDRVFKSVFFDNSARFVGAFGCHSFYFCVFGVACCAFDFLFENIKLRE
jgi:hypothetical protein